MKKKILIADDCATMRQYMFRILSDAQYQVVGQAVDGVEVVELFNKLSPDLVTMDLVMPKESGIESIRQIMETDKNAKIIVVSGVSHETFIMEAIYMGALDYIRKPFLVKELLFAVERALLGEEYILNKSVHSS